MPGQRVGGCDQRDEGGQRGRVERAQVDRHVRRTDAVGRSGGVGALGDEHHPRAPAEVADERVEQLARGVVHPVRVLEAEHDRLDEEAREEPDDRRLELRPAELGVELVDLRRCRHVQPARRPDQRQPRQHVGGVGADHGTELGDPILGFRARRPDADQGSQEIAEREVGRRRLVQPAPNAVERDRSGRRLQLVEQPALARTGVGEDAHVRAGSGLGRVACGPERLDLDLAPDERQVRRGDLGARAARRADRERLDGSGLALHHERCDRGLLEGGARSVEHRARRVHAPWSRLRHHPCREVHRVAHRDERRPEPAADLAREDRTAVGAGAQLQPDVQCDDLVEREQHVLLVVAGAAGCAGAEVELPAVHRQVGRLEADAASIDRHLHACDQRVQASGGLVGTVLLDHRVEPAVLDEGDGGRAVLGVDAARGDRVAQPHGDVVRHRHRCSEELDGFDRCVDPADQPAAVHVARRQRRCRRRADEDLAAVRRRSPAASARTRPHRRRRVGGATVRRGTSRGRRCARRSSSTGARERLVASAHRAIASSGASRAQPPRHAARGAHLGRTAARRRRRIAPTCRRTSGPRRAVG